MKTYTLIRKIHLFTAGVTVTFLLMYFITGFLIVRYNWFEESSQEVISEIRDISLAGRIGEQELVSAIRDQMGIKGKLEQIKSTGEGGYEMVFLKPGSETRVILSPDLRTAEIRQHRHDLYGIITVFHRMHQYGGGMVYNLYIFMMDLASISLIIFSITGMYLWLKIIRYKLWGWLFLFMGFIYTAWVIYTLIS